ncbi:MAG: DUF1272 domain-containing protein [Thermoplasmata archaeon]|nr:DUF1272 domain-containing protein [Thermoplasmata archaeon]
MKAECEGCDASLPRDGRAYICSFECTYCPRCAASASRVCPHCAGLLVRRPPRSTILGSAGNLLRAISRTAAGGGVGDTAMARSMGSVGRPGTGTRSMSPSAVRRSADLSETETGQHPRKPSR